MVTAKLFVSAGNPLQDNSGERSPPPPPAPHCSRESGRSSAMSSLVRVKCGTERKR
jgi:hypothetical protein